MAIPSFSSTVVARAAAAIYGLQLGSGTMQAVLAEANTNGGVESLINSVYNRDFASADASDVASMVASNLGISGAGLSDAVAYLEAALAGAPAGGQGAVLAEAAALFSGLTADPVYGAAATAFNDRIATAVAYSQQAGTSDRAFGAGSTLALTLGQDFLTGTSGNDVIVGRIFDNSNTLQSGDWIDGGSGSDRLEVDMGSSQSFAVTPETTNVEWFSVRGQSRAFDSGDNNVAGEGSVNIDAQRMNGVTRFDSTESRADVLIEDVRTSLRTKDITIGMIGTDAGNVDYAVYFDKLRADSATTATLSIELMDTRAATSADAADAALPLKDSPFNGFSFKVNGKTILLKDKDSADPTDPATFNGAQTYPQLLAAVQALLVDPDNLATYPELASITASLGATFEARDTITGDTATGTTIVLTGSSSSAFVLDRGNFIADDGVPPSSGLHTVQTAGTSSSTDLITSTAILDNVGRGSNGGDLVIGAMSVGETSSSAGIARFEITVENTSNLGIIASTNNALKEVVLSNGTVKGNVSVKGSDNTASLSPGGAAGNIGIYDNQDPVGAVAAHNSRYGFTDVRMINASLMTGTVTYDATVTSAAFAKYIQLSDTGSDPATDNDSTDGKTTRQVADIDYTGGSGNDAIFVQLDDAVTASNSLVQAGREDFTFNVRGLGGNDSISVRIGEAGLAGGDENWYQAQQMNQELNIGDRRGLGQIVIDAGEGNDTVRTPGSGDMTINLGAGNDTVYTDNTGSLTTNNTVITNSGRAMWVFNTSDQTTAGAVERDVDDIESDTNDSYFMYKSELTVTFRGIETQVPVTIGSLATSRKTTDLHINQAIKAAVNNDPVLSKLLLVQDGPANSLIVKSLIDGAYDETDLSVDILNPVDLSAADVTALATAWKAALPASPNETDILDLMDLELTDLLATDDYTTAMGNDFGGTGLDLTGAVSIVTTTDNIITGAAGTDVIVLSTTDAGAGDLGDVDAQAPSVLNSSNETVVYAAAFGDDTIVNFTANIADVAYLIDGADVLDFTGMGGDNFIGGLDATPDDGDIMVDNQLVLGLDETPDLVDIEALFTDVEDPAQDVTAVYVEVSGDNIGYVYQVTDGAKASDLKVVYMGSIDLADTDWFDLVAVNFAG
jgi:hypothetical protein